MERYSHLQTMPNSPLTPLTPLSENTKFEFNFGGDGSLDEYINSVRQEHRVEQQQKKILEHFNQTFQKKICPPLPRRYSQEFLKIRDVFEDQSKSNRQKSSATPNAPFIKITYAGTTPTAKRNKQASVLDYDNTPKNVRTPLKLKNINVLQNISANIQQQEKLPKKKIVLQQKNRNTQRNQSRNFRQASPVATKPLCPQVANILQSCGLSLYCGIFQKEEIDLLAFRLLKLQDLHDMGIKNAKHCSILMQNIYYVGQYF